MKKKIVVILGLLIVSFNLVAQVDIRKNATFFSKGLECKYKDDTEGAIQNFESALRYNSSDDASMFELCEQYVKVNRLDEAFDMIKKAVSLSPDNKWYQMRLGRFYRNFEQYDDFVKIYKPLVAKYPEDPDMLGELIDVLLIKEDYKEAQRRIADLQELIGANSFISRYYNILAKAYMEKGKEKEALKIFDKIKEIDPNDPYINISLLEYYEKKGNMDKAFDELIDGINNQNLDFNTKANIYEYWFDKATSSPKVDQQAFRAGNAFIQNYPENKMGYVILASYYFNQQNYDSCAYMSTKTLEYEPTNYAALQYLVMCDVNLNDNQSLMEHSSEALKIYPTQPIFYWFAGVSYALDHQDEQAINCFEKGRRFVVDKKLLCDFDSYLGDLYHSVGDDEKAFQAYERVLNFDPDNVLVLNNYAYFLSLRNEQLDKAREMALHAIELEPLNSYYLDTYAWVLYKLGNYKDAEVHMKKALGVAKDPNGSNYEHYGDILFRLNKKEEALEYWRKAKEAGNFSQMLEKKLQEGQLYE